MRHVLLTTLTMIAFAANSVLNRAAVGAEHMTALDFALIRAVAGAAILMALVRIRHRSVPVLGPGRFYGGAMLSLYLIGFSIAYTDIDAGIGALILFGGVQITMFAGGLVGGERPTARRWIGAALAFAGLVWLIWPSGDVALPLPALAAMMAAAVGWGLYSLAGRGSSDPLGDTAASFVWATLFGFVATLALTGASTVNGSTWTGIALAVTSGAITSGLGYALWYSVLPQLGASRAGLVQLSVPVIAAAGGVALLSEDPTLRMIGAGALVIGGIAYGLLAPQRTKGSKAS